MIPTVLGGLPRRVIVRKRPPVSLRQIESGATRGALQKLTNDLRRKIEDWLYDNYLKEDPLQYEKWEVRRSSTP